MLFLKHKILLWIDGGFIHYGIAKSLQEKYDCDLYAIIDVNPQIKKFFLDQKFVNFKEKWFFRDCLMKEKKDPDLNYLIQFEKKYKINLWQLAYSERFFLQFNQFYKFSKSEILRILELECKFFEKILSKLKPNYLCIRTTDLHRLHLLFRMCENTNTVPLMLMHTRLGYRLMISSDFDTIDDFDVKLKKLVFEKKDERQNDNIIEKSNMFAQLEIGQMEEPKKFTKWKAILKNIRMLRIINETSYREIYEHYGITPFKFLIKDQFIIPFLIKRSRAKSFLEKYSIKSWKKKHFVYFPLHIEPERTLLISAPFYTNQIEVITNVAKSLPVGYDLFVKEHFRMARQGWRPTSFYKKILELPNVKLVHPSVQTDVLLRDTSLIVTISGTSGLEAGFYKKPAIVFSDVSYSYLPFVSRLNSYEDLPQTIRYMLETKFDFSSYTQYNDLVKSNSFEFDLLKLIQAVRSMLFSSNYNFYETEVSTEKVGSLLNQFKEQFDKLASEHIKKFSKLKSS